MKKLVTSVALVCCPCVAGIAPAAPARPNIVLIMADDHGRQATSCYNPQSLIQTPNIDRLAKAGVRFDAAFANNSICSPSRAVLLTGKYNHLCGVRKLEEPFDGAQQTFPKLLQQAGYQTAIVGKWHLQTEPTGFDYYCVAPGNGGRYVDPMLKEKGQPWGNGNGGGASHKGYMTDVITDVSLDWLEHRDAGKPFCLMIHHKAPHEPHTPAPRHKDLFKDVVFPEPPNLLDDYAGRAPEPVADRILWSRLLQYGGEYTYVRKQFNGDRAHDTRLMYQAYMKGYLRLVAALDENIGRVLDHVDKAGLASNTVVIYTSDNGFFNGEHGFYNKMWMYEESLHLPLIIRMPGGKRVDTCGQMVGMFDIAPTVLDLAGAPVPSDMQGASLKPLLEGNPASWRDAFYYHYYGVPNWLVAANNWVGNHEIIGVRTRTAKLVYYPNWKDGSFWEYFDLAADPHETRNLYREAASQEQVAALKTKLRGLASHYQDTAVVQKIDAEIKSPP
jgi:arylsulfatase A-like enzyme